MTRLDYIALGVRLVIQCVERQHSIGETMQIVSDSYPVLTDNDLNKLREIAISYILLWN